MQAIQQGERVTHFTTSDETHPGDFVWTLCGRTVEYVVPASLYDEAAVLRMVDIYQRMGRTHVTNICGHCARSTRSTG